MRALFALFLLRSVIHAAVGEGELVSVVVIYRHGDRTPIDPYPTDPYKNRSFWPVGFGQLTNRGKQRQYELGKWLRGRYENFLPIMYSENDIYIRSTDVDRTLMSAYANLAGLYEPVKNEIWDPALLWQPIPVHTVPELDDPVLAMKKRCKKYNLLEDKLLKSSPFKEINKQNHDLYAFLTRNTGRLVNSILTLEFVYNNLLIEDQFNFTLPEWTRKVYPEKLYPLAALSFATSCYTQEMARLKVGPLFNDIMAHVNNVTNVTGDTIKRKMVVYSGHDTTIANVLNGLGLFEYHCPPYLSTVLIELRRSNNSHYVNVLYKNSSEPLLMKLKNCSVNCPVEDFRRIVAPISLTVQQWNEECYMNPFMPYTALQDVIIIACSALFIMLVISILVGIVCSRPKNEKRSYLRLPDNDERI